MRRIGRPAQRPGCLLILQGVDRLLAATTCLRSSLVATNRGQRVPPDPSGRLLRRMSQSPFVCRSGGRRLCGPRRGAKPWWTRTSQEIPVPLCVSKRRPTPNPRGLRRGGETLQPNCYTQAVLGWLPGCNGSHDKRPSICSGRCNCSRLSSRVIVRFIVPVLACGPGWNDLHNKWPGHCSGHCWE